MSAKQWFHKRLIEIRLLNIMKVCIVSSAGICCLVHCIDSLVAYFSYKGNACVPSIILIQFSSIRFVLERSQNFVVSRTPSYFHFQLILRGRRSMKNVCNWICTISMGGKFKLRLHCRRGRGIFCRSSKPIFLPFRHFTVKTKDSKALLGEKSQLTIWFKFMSCSSGLNRSFGFC